MSLDVYSHFLEAFISGCRLHDNALSGFVKLNFIMVENQNFGQAIEALKEGKRVARQGWNGKGMWLAMQEGSEIASDQARGGAALARKSESDLPERIKIGAHIDMRAADGSIVIGWLASQTDMLAEDWTILD